MKKIGFIGMGNMAIALAGGFIKSGKLSADDISAYAPNQEKLAANAAKLGFRPCWSLQELTDRADTLIVACKPVQVKDVLCEAGSGLYGKALLSVALGWSFADFHEILGDRTRIQCIMPNTPALVGEGVMLFERENSLYEDERKEVMELFGSTGVTEELPSSLMGIGGAISGCGPAFVDLIIEAYADAGVRYGLQRETAYRLVSQTLLGAAKLQLMTGEHPGVLKDRVCSPGGTTIRGCIALEQNGLRSACIKSVEAVMSAVNK
ncbi:MAG: pyrroline-5-carboxylate reductase [Lachnospiraceae bacterium]|nr:pyrroline-5-carboxylate reductase [Lachnospiraceae bacterium]